MSPFGFVAVLDTSKTATYQKRRGMSPFWRIVVLDVSPFWMCRRYDCRRFRCVAVLVVAVLGVSPFWMCRRFGCVAVVVVAVLEVSPILVVAVLWPHFRSFLRPTLVKYGCLEVFVIVLETTDCGKQLALACSSVSLRSIDTLNWFDVSFSS